MTNPVIVPQYSVVRLEWDVFTAPSPTLTLTVTNSAQVLAWSGLTNVTYKVQSTTNLFSFWTTLASVAEPQTSFRFTNWSSGPMQFYRLTVP